MKALSIRQPWAWLLANGHKDVENRTWPTRYRGPVLIHASKGMTRDDYIAAGVVAHHNGVKIPPFEELDRGGVVGVMTITDCVQDSKSLWFFGPHGFTVADARPLPFQACKGKLGFFEVEGERVTD